MTNDGDDPQSNCGASAAVACESGNQTKRRFVFFLRAVALVTFLAFGAAIMPADWIVESSEFLGFEPFPESPLTFYLARHLSLLYGFVGVLLWIASSDVDHYRDLIRKLGWLTICFGLGQAVVDVIAGLPGWWTAGESVSTIFGGGLILWLDRLLGTDTSPNRRENSTMPPC